MDINAEIENAIANEHVDFIKGWIHGAIDKFAKDRRLADGGGWAPVHDEDLDQLHCILNALLVLKFQRDCDGDLPINFEIIDRTKFEPSHFMPVPYNPFEASPEKKAEHMKEVAYNLETAAKAMIRAIKIQELDADRKKGKA